MGRAFVMEVFQGRETMGMGDAGVQGSDINDCHDAVQRDKSGKGLYKIKEIYP